MSAARYPRIADAAAFGKVAVLLGGKSSEREISLLTGEAVSNPPAPLCTTLAYQPSLPVAPSVPGL